MLRPGEDHDSPWTSLLVDAGGGVVMRMTGGKATLQI